MIQGRPRHQHDVVIVGAGFAGLAAALQFADEGLDFIVLEARDRVGGRTVTEQRGRVSIEGGGQFIGPAQGSVLALAERYGRRTFPAYDEGDWLFEQNGRWTRETEPIPKLPAQEAAELVAIVKKLDDLAQTVPLDAPGDAPRAEALDSVTVEAWVRDQAKSPAVRSFLRVGVEILVAADWCQFSLLHALVIIGTCGGTEAAIWESQQLRLIGGTQALAEAIAEDLSGRIRLGAVVAGVEAGTAGVVVVLSSGESISGKRAIVALPPTLAGRLRYSPPLPATRDRLFQQMPNGNVIKAVAVYKRPFWRSEGLNGLAVSTSGRVGWIYDNCWEDGATGMLVGFGLGRNATDLMRMGPEQRRAAILGEFASAFGEPARDCRDYVEFIWAEEEFSRGCYCGYGPPGFWTQAGREMRQPVGPLFWAGTETATKGMSFIDGAIASGQAAALRTIESLED